MSVSLLRRSPLLRALPAPALRLLLRDARRREFSSGARIFSKSERADHLFIVERGRVKIYTAGGARKRKTFAYLGPGKFFGEMALLDGRERSASAEAVEPSRVLMIHKASFRRLLEGDPKLAIALLRTLADRLRQADEEIEGLMFRNVLGRVSKMLVGLADKGGRPSRGGLLLDGRFTQQDLADLVGTTREPLSRALATLRRADLVSTRHGRLFLRNPRKMRELVG